MRDFKKRTEPDAGADHEEKALPTADRAEPAEPPSHDAAAQGNVTEMPAATAPAPASQSGRAPAAARRQPAQPSEPASSSNPRIQIRTTVEESVDKKVSALARQMKLTPDIIYRFVRDRAYDRFRTILRENEDIELGPAPKKRKSICVRFAVTPAEMKEVRKRFDPLNMGSSHGLAGPLSKLFTEKVERLEADRR